MISWELFSVRAQLWGLDPRSVAEWGTWARSNERSVSFRTKGRWRQAHRAVGRLDTAHKQARAILATGWTPSAAVHGFVRGKSTKSAAAVHAGSRSALTLDLEDFFGQVTSTVLRTLCGPSSTSVYATGSKVLASGKVLSPWATARVPCYQTLLSGGWTTRSKALPTGTGSPTHAGWTTSRSLAQVFPISLGAPCRGACSGLKMGCGRPVDVVVSMVP